MAVIFEVNPERIMKEFSKLNSLDFQNLSLGEIKNTYNKTCGLIRETKNTIKAFDILMHSWLNEKDRSFRRKESIKERKKPHYTGMKLHTIFRPRIIDRYKDCIDGSIMTYHSFKLYDVFYVKHNGEYITDIKGLKNRYVKILKDLRVLAKYIQQEYLNSDAVKDRVFLQRPLPLEY